MKRSEGIDQQTRFFFFLFLLNRVMIFQREVGVGVGGQ